MEDTSQEEKQNFLRENILDKGYDVNQFVSFLKSKKGEAGSDIANWSMVDLYEVVQEFSSKYSTDSKPELKTQDDEIKPKTQLNVSPTITTIEGVGALTEEDFGLVIPEYVECLKLETTELSKYDNIEITVKEPKKVDNGFFSKTFINFLITTNPINANVRRRHEDFVWLRERLSIIFNLNVLPRLPKKGKVNEDKHINKRMRNLERFLVYLAKDPLVKNSQIFYDFLTIEKDSDFEKRKKIYNRLKTPIELKDIKTINGKMKINITIRKEQHLENIRDNAAFNETALKKFNQNFKLLKEEMKTVISRVLSFGPLFDKLLKISTTYLDNNIIIESYNQMKNIFNTWADTLKKQNTFFFTDVKEYLKLLSGNYHHLRDLVQYVEKIKTSYNKTSRNLTNKKMELFRKGDVSSWQLDEKDKKNLNEFFSDRLASYKKICFKETTNVIKLKEKYGYHLNKIIFEYQRLRNINTIENKEKTIQFSKKQSQIVSDHNKKMEEIIDTMEKCLMEKNKDEIDVGQNLAAKINEQEEKKDEIIENKISTENNENSKDDVKNVIIEEQNEQKKEENKNEIKEEKIEDNNKDKIEEKEENKKEENNEEKKEENIEEKKEEEKVEEKNFEEKNEQINNEDKKEEQEENINEDKKEEIVEEKNEERKEEEIEEKKEDVPNENNEEEK